jgi:hypothetical protein
MSEHTFRPWLKPLLWGVALSAFGAAAFGLSALLDPTTPHILGVVLSASSLCIGVVMIRNGLARLYGQRVEASAAQRLLKALPAHCSTRLAVALPGGGDVDIQIDDRLNNRQWLVEVKSHSGVEIRWKFPFGLGSTLRPLGGGRFKVDPLEQVLRQAAARGMAPVIWFPRARVKQVNRLRREGVVVVQGDEKVLMTALKLRRTLWQAVTQQRSREDEDATA